MFVDYNEVNSGNAFYISYHSHWRSYYGLQQIFFFFFLSTQPQVERVYSSYLELNLADVEPCVSGPKR